MMQIVDYQQTDKVVSVGFVKNGFVVYGAMGIVDGYSKAQYLQELYRQCKPAIDYETAQYEQGKPNSLTTDVIGEEFTPEPPRVAQLRLAVDTPYVQFAEGQTSATVELTTTTIDQYRESIAVEVNLSASVGTITDNTLTIPAPSERTEVTVTATAGEIATSVKLVASPYTEPQIVDEPVDEEQVAMAEAIVDLESRLATLEGRV